MKKNIGQHSAKSDRWLTPQWIVDLAHNLLGEIDLDPASEASANQRIKANRFIAQDEDGLLSNWGDASKIFLNPPGGRLDKVKYAEMYDRYECGSLPQAFFTKAVKHLNLSGYRSSLFFVGFSLEQLATLSRNQNSREFMQEAVILVPPDRVEFERPEDRKLNEDGTLAKESSPSHSNFLLIWSNCDEVKSRIRNLVDETDMLVLGRI